VFIGIEKGYDFMKVLFISPEAAPFVKTGGLGDVAGSLPEVLNQKGVDTRVILPLYKCIPQEYKDKMKYITNIYIDITWRKQYCGIFELEYNGTIFYFIDNKFYFDGDKPYDFIHLDAEKFIFFSKAALSILPSIGFRPDVINCNDWQTGAVPVYLDTFRNNEFYQGIKTVMTVHNLKFQGRWDFKGIKDVMGISDYYFTPDKLEYYKDANLLKGGLVYADIITTVSDTYAWEITTQEYGEGLNELLSARRNSLRGIVNGISYTDWNPATDKMIYENYDEKTVFEKKKENKIKLQQELGLPVDENKLLVGLVSRLTDQKGLDLIAYHMERLVEGGMQFVILGTGDEKYENLFRHYAWKNPTEVSANIYFSNELSHKIYAGCDAFLMPSRFEPCGLSQLISLRYGTVPIVRETGGLKDTVTPFNEYTDEGTGFSFTNYNADEMLHVIYYAMDIYYNKRDKWNTIIANGMKQDFSWNTSADKYIAMYREMTGIYETPEPPKPKRSNFKKKLQKAAEQAEIDLFKEEEPAPKLEIEPKPAKKAPAKKTTAKKATEKKPAAKKSTTAKAKK